MANKDILISYLEGKFVKVFLLQCHTKISMKTGVFLYLTPRQIFTKLFFTGIVLQPEDKIIVFI